MKEPAIKVSELIKRLQELQDKYGDLPVYRCDETAEGRGIPLSPISALVDAYDDHGISSTLTSPTHIYIH